MAHGERHTVGQTLSSTVVGFVPDEERKKFDGFLKTMLMQERPSELELGNEGSLLFERVSSELFGQVVVRQLVGHLSRLGEDDRIHPFA